MIPLAGISRTDKTEAGKTTARLMFARVEVGGVGKWESLLGGC